MSVSYGLVLAVGGTVLVTLGRGGGARLTMELLAK